MNANLAVIADNLDYLLWGRLAEGQPGGVALTLLMADRKSTRLNSSH